MKHFLRMSENPIHNKSLWAISWVSFLGGTASTMVLSLLSFFMRDELGLSYKELGMIEGIAIFTAFMAKVFSGILSDYWKSRKSLILIGTFGSVLIKPIFALAGGIFWIFIARTIDRLSKGIRAAPTDALIADLSPKRGEGNSYGTRYTMYAFGFMCGGGLSSLILWLSSNNYRLVFWLSIIPATLAFLILYFYVGESTIEKPASSTRKHEWKWRDIKHLPVQFWHLLVVTFLLMNARFSESFLSLRAKELGWEITVIPLFMVLYNLVEATTAMPIGKLADRLNRKKMLLSGILVLTFTNIIMIMAPSKGIIIIGMLCAGLHMGMTQGLIGTLIAESTLPHLRGTAFALYYFVAGVALLTGNYVAGHVSDLSHGAIGAFYCGLLFTCLSAEYLAFALYYTRRES